MQFRTKMLVNATLVFMLSAASARASSAPGKWRIVPDVLVSGKTTPLELAYSNGERSLPADTTFRVAIEPLSVKNLLFCAPSTDIRLKSSDSNASPVVLKAVPVDGVGYREVGIQFPKGLRANETFSLVIGNDDGHGNIIALVNPVPVHNLAFEVYSNLERLIDWQQAGWGQALPKVDIIAAPASRLRLFAPSLIRTKAKFDLRIAVTDAFDSAASPVYTGRVVIDSNVPLSSLPATIKFTKFDLCSKLLTGLSFAKPGVYRVRAKLPDYATVFESNPIVVRDDVEEPLYWGLIHNHGWYSECWGDDLDHFYGFARDIAGLDYVALSDHCASVPVQGQGASRLLRWRLDHTIDSLDAWNDTIVTADKFNSNGFVTLIGYEWSSMDAGHYNIYYADANLANRDRIFLQQYSDYGFVMRKLLRTTDALFIPHKHADIFPYYTLVEVPNKDGQPLTPVIEVYSDWGESLFPYGVWNSGSLYGGLRTPLAKSYLWAIENHYKLGAIGDSDSHTGIPGRRNPGGISPEHKHPQGLTAVRASDFSRKGVMHAYRARQTYATTGERIFLEVKADKARMGDTLYTDKPFSVEVNVAGTDVIENVNIYKGLTLLATKNFNNAREGTVFFDGLEPCSEECGYIVAVVQKDQNRAFASPIWVQRASLPDLAWQIDDKGAWLINCGNAAVDDVDVACDANEYPFVSPAIEPHQCRPGEQAGFVWTDPQSNMRTILHYRWQGPPLAGTIKITGAKNYEFDFNRDFIFSKKKFIDKGNGFAEFTTGPINSPQHSQGIDIICTVYANSPCSATFTFESEVTTLIGDEIVKATTIVIPLNGRNTSGPLSVIHSGQLKPGQKWLAGTKKAYYTADPFNAIVEKNKSNNLIRY